MFNFNRQEGILQELKVEEFKGVILDRQYLNGTLWQAPNRLIAMLQYLNDGLFCLLDVQEQALYGHSCLCVITDADGKWQYREDELPSRLEKWIPLLHNVLKIEQKNNRELEGEK